MQRPILICAADVKAERTERDPADVAIGQALKDLRIKRRLTRLEVARRCKLQSAPALDRIENGYGPILFRDVRKLLRAYDADFDDLLL